MKTIFQPLWLTPLLTIACSAGTEKGFQSQVEELPDPPSSTVTWTGNEDGDALGSALVIGTQSWFAGAPGGATGHVYSGSTNGLSLYLTEISRGALGSSLAIHPVDGLLAGAPLRDEGRGAIVAEGGDLKAGGEQEVLGLRLRVRGETLLALSGLGYWIDDVQTLLPRRASDIDLWDGDVVLGFRRGEYALEFRSQVLARPETRDEAGFSLCASDFDGDGNPDLAVGSPGNNRVYLFLGSQDFDFATAQVLEGPGGRFGHALACGEQQLLVGAPLHLALRGAAWKFEGSPEQWNVAEPWLEGEETGDQLGFALATNGQFSLLGAPGLATGPGKVICAP